MGVSKYKESALGASYHLYNRGNGKQIIFFGDEDRRLYLGLLRKFAIETGFLVIAYCLMPNHVHLLVRQRGQDGPSKLISRLHTSYSMYFNKKFGKVGHLFQGRYKQKIVADDNYLVCLLSYIHLNPVKDQLTLKPESYEWSSYGEYRSIIVGGFSRRICDLEELEKLGIKVEQVVNKVDEFATKINSNDAFDSP
ncbi:MAG: transposase [Patescibacteria group bacterium]